jgi:hypothetical protein
MLTDKVVKFYYDLRSDKNGFDQHWNYCCKNDLPFVRIIKQGKKYCSIEFDVISITKSSRLLLVDFSGQIIKFYTTYIKQSRLPVAKSLIIGGGSSLIFKVYSKDAEQLAELTFDLILILSKWDETFFDLKPFELNEEGYNSEGVHVKSFQARLKTFSTKELLSGYQVEKEDNPTKKKTIELYKDEISKRESKIK